MVGKIVLPPCFIFLIYFVIYYYIGNLDILKGLGVRYLKTFPEAGSLIWGPENLFNYIY